MEQQACGRSIRPLTQAERDRREEMECQLYDDTYASIEARQRTEYEKEFGLEYRAKHPFRPNAKIIHRLTTEAIEKAKNEH